MQHKPPKPDTTRACLVSAGIPVRTATVHHYYATRLVTIPGIGQAWEFIFRCFRSGAERRWGLAPGPNDGPPPPSHGDPGTRDREAN